jgi:hypothetical protein
MLIRRPVLVIVIVLAAVVALPVAWYLISPLFINQVVDEPLPTVAVAANATEPAMAATDDAMMAATDIAVAMATGEMATMAMATDAMATDSMATEVMATDAMATEVMATSMAENATATEVPVTATEAPTTTVLAVGDFYNVVHEGHGQATVFQFTDGSRVLRLEDFEVLNGPELHVYLVPIDPVPQSGGVEIEGSVDLGNLKGNIGSQNYDLPPDLDLSQFRSVVIWCQPFRVPFIAAPLGSAN